VTKSEFLVMKMAMKAVSSWRSQDLVATLLRRLPDSIAGPGAVEPQPVWEGILRYLETER